MSTFLVIAAAAGLTWLLRVALVTVVPVHRLPRVLMDTLRYAAPAAFAAILVASVTAHGDESGGLGRTSAAVAITVLACWWRRTMTTAVVVGALAITILTMV
jgi:branched-subunit amino acid transport protein